MSEPTEQALNTTGEEAGNVDTASDVDQAIEQVDSSGFDDDENDGSSSSDSNSIDNTDGEKKIEGEKPNNNSTQPGRAEKRDRGASGRIQQVIAERQAERELREKAEAELEQYRAQAKQAKMAQMRPQADEDGNYSADDLLAYQQQIADQAKQDAINEFRQEMADEKSRVAGESMIATSSRIWDDAIRENPILKDDKIAESVRARAVQAAAPFVERRDFTRAEQAVRAQITDDLQMLSAAETAGRSQRATSLENLRNNSAIVSASAGNNVEKDPMLDGFDDD